MSTTNSLVNRFLLSTLPKPDIIREPDHEALFEEALTLFKDQDEAYAYFLAGDPAVNVIMTGAYREATFRHYCNAIAASRHLALASGADLDHIGASGYAQVQRLLISAADASTNPPTEAVYEDDEAYRLRIQLAISSVAKAGTEEGYRFHALSADPRVRDVAVYSPDFMDGNNFGGRVNVAVLSNEPTLIPSLDLLDKVRRRLTQSNVKMLTDIVGVETAVPVDFTVTARVSLYPTTPVEVFTGLTEQLTTAFAKEQRLGWDITKSWLTRQLHVDGVYDVQVTTPAASFKVTPIQFPRLTEVNLVFGGFAVTEDFDIAEMDDRRVYQRVYDYYIDYCIRVKRTPEQIAADLAKYDRDGIVQPTTLGLARFLGIQPLTDHTTGEVLPEDELAFLIHRVISKYYAAGTRSLS